MKFRKLRVTKSAIEKSVVPEYETYIITDNNTLSNGNVVNSKEINADLARKWVDDNEK